MPSGMKLNYKKIHTTFSNSKHCQISGSSALQLPEPDILQIAISSWIPDAWSNIRTSLIWSKPVSLVWSRKATSFIWSRLVSSFMEYASFSHCSMLVFSNYSKPTSSILSKPAFPIWNRLASFLWRRLAFTIWIRLGSSI